MVILKSDNEPDVAFRNCTLTATNQSEDTVTYSHAGIESVLHAATYFGPLSNLIEVLGFFVTPAHIPQQMVICGIIVSFFCCCSRSSLKDCLVLHFSC